MPPAAFTPTAGPPVSRINRTAWTVAPPAALKPVEVLTKSAPASAQIVAGPDELLRPSRSAASRITFSLAVEGIAPRTADT